MPNLENITPLPSEHESVDGNVEHFVSKEFREKVGRYILYRRMSLEQHSDIQHVAEDGVTTEYIVNNQQYPDQGDFAFMGNRAFQQALELAYPRHTYNVYAVEAEEHDVVVPHPDASPDVAYIKNGAQVVARRVPREDIDSYIENPSVAPVDLTVQIAEKLFPSKY